MVFDRLVSVRHIRLMERRGVLSTTHCVYRKGLGTYDTNLFVSNTFQSALESGQEVRILQIDFGATFYRGNDTIGEFSSSSALWALEVPCCLF